MIVLYIIGGILLFVLSLIVAAAVAYLLTLLIFDIIWGIEDLSLRIAVKAAEKEEKRKNREKER